MPKFKSTITNITHLKVVVFFALLSSTRLFKSLSPNLRQGKGDLHIKRHFFCFNFSQLPFFSFKFNVFVFIICLCFCYRNNNNNKKKRIRKTNRSRTRKKKKTSHCQIQRVVNTFKGCRISFMTSECATAPSK